MDKMVTFGNLNVQIYTIGTLENPAHVNFTFHENNIECHYIKKIQLKFFKTKINCNHSLKK
jgi:hypothetical protein